MRFIITFIFCLLLASPIARAADLHILIWSDYIDPQIPKQFEAQTHTHVILDLYEETEAMIAKLQAAGGSKQYDLIIASDHAIPLLARLHLIAPLNLAKIPNAKNVDKPFQHPPYDPQGTYSLPYQWGTVGIIYNKKKIPTPPSSWQTLFNPVQAPGNFLLLENMRDLLGTALKAQHHSVNSRVSAEVQSAGQLLLAAKKSPKCLGFDGSPSACKKVVSGQADLAIVYNGDALNAIKEDKTNSCDYLVPTEGSIIWVDTMVLTSQGPNPAAAQEFMNYILDPKVGAQLSNFINYATPNAAAMPDIAKESRENPRIYPPADQLKTLEYLEDLGPATRLYDATWTALKAR